MEFQGKNLLQIFHNCDEQIPKIAEESPAFDLEALRADLGDDQIGEFEFLRFSFVGGFVGVPEKLGICVYSLCFASECLCFEL